MKEINFSYTFMLNKNGIPFSESDPSGKVSFDIANETIYVTGDKDGLLALASKIIEVANCDIAGYHKHLDEVEVPNLEVVPSNLDLIIGKIED